MKKQTIVFKKEFEVKLKKLRIKTKFIHNIKHYRTEGDSFKERIIFLNKESNKNWRNFILAAFSWENTPEGVNYWSKVSEK